MRELTKWLVDALLIPLGVRVINRSWGPRGHLNALSRLKAAGFAPATIIDVGASDGRWTRECLSVFQSARYALFDALAEHESPLKTLAEAMTTVTFWRGALGSEPGQITINAHGHQSSIFASTSFPGQPMQVEMRTLDSFIEPMTFKAPMLIKADVQGYELEVLKGAPRCLEMTEVLLLEVSFRRVYAGSPLAHEVIDELGTRGYRIYDICSYVQRASDHELVHADIVFAKNDSKIFANEGWH